MKTPLRLVPIALAAVLAASVGFGLVMGAARGQDYTHWLRQDYTQWVREDYTHWLGRDYTHWVPRDYTHLVHATDWIGDPEDSGDWFDEANWNNGVPAPWSNATIDNGGTATIAGVKARARDLQLGVTTQSTLEITGGSAEFSTTATLGLNAGSRGRLIVSGGTLAIGALRLGNNSGEGVVQQSGGTVKAGWLTLGDWQLGWAAGPINGSQPEHYGRGRYRLADGTLTVTGDATIGSAGVGVFRQDGGRVQIDGAIHIGGVLESLDSSTEDMTLYSPLVADVVQRVWFPFLVPSRGRYDLHDGELVGGDLFIDRTGVYRQTGGAADVEFVAVRSGGQLNLRSGSLHAEYGFHAEEELDLNGQQVSLSVGAGILDLSSGVRGARNASIAAGADSLVILPQGFDAHTQFGAFNRQGLVHVTGNDLVLAADKRIAGAGVIEDFVIARGTIAAAPDRGITLAQGLRLPAGAQVDLGQGGLAATGSRATVFNGGELATASIVVGGNLGAPWGWRFSQPSAILDLRNPAIAATPGLVRQQAGAVDVASRVSVLSGDYRLTGGTLDANTIDVGVNHLPNSGANPIRARFIQTGGTVRTLQLTLSQTYLHAAVTDFGPVTRAQPAAGDEQLQAITPPPLTPVVDATLDARYRLEAGLLAAENISLHSPWRGTGASTRFVQTGGRVEATREVSIQGESSTWIASGGSLVARRFTVGSDFAYPAGWTPPPSGTLAVRDAASDIEIAGPLTFGAGSSFRAVPGTTIRLTNPDQDTGEWRVLASSQFRNFSLDADDLVGLRNLSLVFDGMTDVASTLEVAGVDRGSAAVGYRRNFTLGSLHVGGEDPAWVQLVDLIDNQRDGGVAEALYVDTLVVTAGSTLDLAGLNLYYRHAQLEGVVETGGGAMFAAVPEPSSLGLGCIAGLTAGVLRRGKRRVGTTTAC